MIDNDTLNKILTDSRMAGHDAKVRDVCFVLLSRYIDDKTTIFRSLFDKEGKMAESQVNNYLQSDKVKYLDDVLQVYEHNPKHKKQKKDGESISFDENLAYMLKLKKRTEEEMAAGKVDKATGLKILSDITVKLNDKFKITEEHKEQMVVVNMKYDAICPVCQAEVARRPISKSEAMEMYGLVEK